MREGPTPSAIWQVNKDVLGAFICAGIGLASWDAHSPDFYIGGFIAAVMWFAATKCLLRALWNTIKLIAHSLRWSRFQKKGSARPRARSCDL